MKLCETCKKSNCNRNIIIKQEGEVSITKCLDYEKDIDKIKGYVKPLNRTAKVQPLVMDRFISDWSKY